MTGIILEGGGMRGAFTTGVIDSFLENNLIFDNCLAVSAGACNACSLLSRQHKRAFDVSVSYVGERRYCSIYNLITTKNLFGVKMLYDLIPNKLYPIDNETFLKSQKGFYVSVTNCKTGSAEYLQIQDMKKDIDYIRASSSLPLISTMVNINGTPYLDGGIADSIPIKQSIKMGNNKNIIVLTRHKEYRKSPNSSLFAIKLIYNKYPNLVKSIKNRYKEYNQTLDFIESEEEKGNVFVIRPPKPLNLTRTDKNKSKLTCAYELGHNYTNQIFNKLNNYLEN